MSTRTCSALAPCANLDRGRIEVLLERLVDLDVSLQYAGYKLRQLNSSLRGFTGEIFPDASLDRNGQIDLCAGGYVMESSDAFLKIDLLRHFVIFNRPITHGFSLYCRTSFGVASRAEMTRIVVAAGSDSNHR
jgi:hypothetical protein